jgi:hypothetical protein
MLGCTDYIGNLIWVWVFNFLLLCFNRGSGTCLVGNWVGR